MSRLQRDALQWFRGHVSRHPPVETRSRPYPEGGGIWVGKTYDGEGNNVVLGGAYAQYTWYKFRVDEDSETGVVNIFVDDVFVGTYTVTTPVRSGLTGLHSGNSGGAFDNFRIQTLRR